MHGIEKPKKQNIPADGKSMAFRLTGAGGTLISSGRKSQVQFGCAFCAAGERGCIAEDRNGTNTEGKQGRIFLSWESM